MKLYQIGGSVRDELLGIKAKDIDYAVECDSFDNLYKYISSIGEIFLSKPEFLTIRARINNEVSDFVMCRKDGQYYDGRHPENVIPGTLYEDQKRRDFTMNAIAKDEDGTYIDPFNGIDDIRNRLIRCVGNTEDRMREDYLRLLRAARFCITKNMLIDIKIGDLFNNLSVLNAFEKNVSEERIREELYKMFKCSTFKTIMFFGDYPYFSSVCFNATNIWLKPTSEKR